MCGLTGFYCPHSASERDAIGLDMAKAISHRGPDDAGVWTDEATGLTLAHRRLSILDLSPAGHQPMHSACSRYVIVFNGEIYNHRELRERLHAEGVQPAWRGHADTETLLACIAAWGMEKALQATVGMFAIALWDRQSRQLTLARDRVGEKPLYWGWQNGTLLFGSELKALKAHPAFHATVNRDAIALLLRHGYISAPHSIYQGIHKLCAGHYITIPLEDQRLARTAKAVPYWRMNDTIHAGLNDPFLGTASAATDALEKQLSTSIHAQMLSDVPLGAFLSGGIDSSTIVALMQAQSARPVRTFTIGFDDPRYNEAQHASVIAQHLGTDHTELYVQPGDALAVIPRLPEIYDEPFADSSQIPTYLVCQLARQHVTVSLSGDAGDELFGGYNTYEFAPALWKKISRLPAPLRSTASAIMSKLPASSWDSVLKVLGPLIPGRAGHTLSGEKIHKAAGLLSADSRESFYHRLSSHWERPEHIAIGAREPASLLNSPHDWPHTDSFEHWMMAVGTQSYMADDILPKVDRAAMANSLEVRIPMLDHRVIELAWRMPLAFKLRDGKGKWLLREVLYRYVPRELIERPKKGFSIPLAAWLRGPLRDWAEALLDEHRLRREGYFYPAPVRQAWRLHLEGKQDFSARLWSLLMFQAWLENQQ